MIRATDLYMARAVEIILEDIRKNRYLVYDILGGVIDDPILKDIYGHREVEKLNQFINKEVQVSLEYNMNMAKLPAIGIRVGGGTEYFGSTGDALSYGFRTEVVELDNPRGAPSLPQVILGPLTPENYDPITGKITFSDDVSLEKVFDGMQVYDEINQKAYPIIALLDNQSILIEPNQTPNLDGMTIRTRKNKVTAIRKEFFVNETVTFVCVAQSPVEAVYLYQILLYGIGRNRLRLFESKNFKASSIQYSQLYKLTDDPMLTFAREITMTGIVEHSFIESTGFILDGVGHGVKIAGSETPSDMLEQVKLQGWQGEND